MGEHVGDRPELVGVARAAAQAEAEAEAVRKAIRLGVKIFAGFILGVIALIWMWKLATPRYNLYRAETEKKAVIAEQRAQSEAAEFRAISEVTQAQAKADAEVIRAKGLAQAQQIISSTLTEDYIRYLYIQAIEGNPNQIIYVPTEAGLPILEAGRVPKAGE